MPTEIKETRDSARSRDKLTVDDICDDLGISRRIFYEWRAKGKAPECTPLPNGETRVTRNEYARWYKSLRRAA